jgi:chromosome segregation ATPase
MDINRADREALQVREELKEVVGRIENLSSTGVDRYMESIDIKLSSIMTQNSEIKVKIAESRKDIESIKETVNSMCNKVDRHEGLINKGLGAIAVIGGAAAYIIYITKEFFIAIVRGEIRVG